MDGVRIIKVIVASNATIGKGVEGDPMRRTLQMYNIEGNLILEIYPGKGNGDIASLRRYNPNAMGV